MLVCIYMGEKYRVQYRQDVHINRQEEPYGHYSVPPTFCVWRDKMLLSSYHILFPSQPNFYDNATPSAFDTTQGHI